MEIASSDKLGQLVLRDGQSGRSGSDAVCNPTLPDVLDINIQRAVSRPCL